MKRGHLAQPEQREQFKSQEYEKGVSGTAEAAGAGTRSGQIKKYCMGITNKIFS
jgi:hypothetical protein